MKQFPTFLHVAHVFSSPKPRSTKARSEGLAVASKLSGTPKVKFSSVEKQRPSLRRLMPISPHGVRHASHKKNNGVWMGWCSHEFIWIYGVSMAWKNIAIMSPNFSDGWRVPSVELAKNGWFRMEHPTEMIARTRVGSGPGHSIEGLCL